MRTGARTNDAAQTSGGGNATKRQCINEVQGARCTSFSIIRQSGEVVVVGAGARAVMSLRTRCIQDLLLNWLPCTVIMASHLLHLCKYLHLWQCGSSLERCTGCAPTVRISASISYISHVSTGVYTDKCRIRCRSTQLYTHKYTHKRINTCMHSCIRSETCVITPTPTSI